MIVTKTARLVVRHLRPDDAPFVLALVNDPEWLRFIGDKHVHTLDDARDYIEREGTEKYTQYPLGLNLVELKDGAVPVGICGLKKRVGLEYPDLGFAFLNAYRGYGYAFEACKGLMMQLFSDAFTESHPQPLHLLAITIQDNHASIRLLEKLGFGFLRLVRLPASTTELRLYRLILDDVKTVPQRAR